MSLDRLIRGAPGRRTRFHTLRGEFIGWRGIADLPIALLERFRPRDEPTPWLTPAVIRFLNISITPSWSVVEFGGGESTIWLAQRARLVRVFEDNEGWASTVRRRLQDHGLSADLQLIDPDGFQAAARALASTSMDLVIVDHTEVEDGDRVKTVLAACAAVKVGGLMVLDDSDRPQYADVDKGLEGWDRLRFHGIRSRPMQASETTVYRRLDG